MNRGSETVTIVSLDGISFFRDRFAVGFAALLPSLFLVSHGFTRWTGESETIAFCVPETAWSRSKGSALGMGYKKDRHLRLLVRSSVILSLDWTFAQASHYATHRCFRRLDSGGYCQCRWFHLRGWVIWMSLRFCADLANTYIVCQQDAANVATYKKSFTYATDFATYYLHK